MRLKKMPKGFERDENVFLDSKNIKYIFESEDQLEYYFGDDVTEKMKESVEKYGGFWVSEEAISVVNRSFVLLNHFAVGYNPACLAPKRAEEKKMLEEYNKTLTDTFAVLPNGNQYNMQLRWMRLTSRQMAFFGK